MFEENPITINVLDPKQYKNVVISLDKLQVIFWLDMKLGVLFLLLELNNLCDYTFYVDSRDIACLILDQNIHTINA